MSTELRLTVSVAVVLLVAGSTPKSSPAAKSTKSAEHGTNKALFPEI